ncbi:MAG: hypothetical protein EBR82_76685 [Caulobacteraceae bacterium]|nr:hypothetical protein [Caulobacteraceae bacterium]
MPVEMPMYTIDADRLTIRDMMTLSTAGTAGDMTAVLPILEKCVITDDGRKVEDLPATHLRIIVKALTDKLSGSDSGN